MATGMFAELNTALDGAAHGVCDEHAARPQPGRPACTQKKNAMMCVQRLGCRAHPMGV